MLANTAFSDLDPSNFAQAVASNAPSLFPRVCRCGEGRGRLGDGPGRECRRKSRCIG